MQVKYYTDNGQPLVWYYGEHVPQVGEIVIWQDTPYRVGKRSTELVGQTGDRALPMARVWLERVTTENRG